MSNSTCVSNDYIMTSQELLDNLYESGPLTFCLNIVTLCEPEVEQHHKSHGMAMFPRSAIQQHYQMTRVRDVPTLGTATGMTIVLPNYFSGATVTSSVLSTFLLSLSPYVDYNHRRNCSLVAMIRWAVV